MTPTDYYALLGVKPNATPEEIRRAYAPLAQAAMNSNDRDRFDLLHAAFETLKDPDARAAYDAAIAQNANMAPTMGMPAWNATQMPVSGRMASPGGGALVPAGLVPMGGSERTAFIGQDSISLGKHPCPYNESPCADDGGFCVKCGFLIGSPLGEAIRSLPLPSLKDASGRTFLLQIGENIVGREAADVILPDKSISRRHAKIQVESGNVVALQDLNSTNGTKHKGVPVPAGTMAGLRDGDVVQFGSVLLTITIPGAPGARLSLPAAPVSRPAISAAPPVATVRPGSMVAVPAQNAKLVGAKGSHLLKAATTFGRKVGNDVVLEGDAFVSGSHGKIERDGSTFYLIDIGSTNGTKLNGRKLAPNVREALKEGDAVIFGQTEFTFRLG